MSCGCNKTTLQGKQYCQDCMPDDYHWLVPVSKKPDPFLMDRHHAYIMPNNTIYVLSQLKSRKENLLTIGTKFNSKTETIVLNKKFIEKEIKTLDKAIIKCESELTEFNKLASLSVYQAAA